jgi:formylglycine-generating enzyme required for sulfatase activity
MFKNLSIIVILATMISACNNDDGGGKNKSMADASSSVVVDNYSKYENQITELQKQIDDLKDKLDNKTPATPVITPPPPDTFVAGKVFQDPLKDGGFGPEMVMIPAGTFRMGGEYSYEQPVHEVSVDRFAMGKFEVTVGEYMKFVKATNTHAPEWLEEGSKYNIKTGTDDYYTHYKEFGSALTNENHPIVGVSWNDATAYAKWLSDQTGKEYRLPTEAEWEYAARAGTDTEYWWGNEIGKNKANCYGDMCGDSFEYTSPVGSFDANQFGLYDTSGNVWEWTCSEYTDKYNNQEKQCFTTANRLSLRGGSWLTSAWSVRSAGRGWGTPTYRADLDGFRVSRLVTL